MNIKQETWKGQNGWKTVLEKGSSSEPSLVLAFGGRALLGTSGIYEQLKEKYPTADIVTCSTSGEIADIDVLDNSLVTTAIGFDHTTTKIAHISIQDCQDSRDAGVQLVNQLDTAGLRHVFVISDGQLINGSELVAGMNATLPEQVAATGGLAGDGYDFNKTLVGLNDVPREGSVIAIGFYGDRLQIGFGSKGGWDAFGPERKVTKSEGNVLYELDGQSALALYKQYLGEAAKELPSSALYYPLSISTLSSREPLVRTILSIDEESQSMIFAGDIPEGSTARLMKHNFDNLIDGAEQAAQYSINALNEANSKPELAILVSCVGRKIVLGQNIEEEVEAIRDCIGEEAAITGFYSYGEIAPQAYYANSELHNQTMTITTFSEV